MDKKLFSDLVTSLKQAGQIAQGERKPSRVYRFSTSRVKAIRGRTKLSPQAKQTGDDYQTLLTSFCFERFLYRLWGI